jgi:hypothetical protein
MQLVQPAPLYLAGYVDALKRGWSTDNVRGATAALTTSFATGNRGQPGLSSPVPPTCLERHR